MIATTADESTDFVRESLLYKEFLAEREEILRHNGSRARRPVMISGLKRRCSTGS